MRTLSVEKMGREFGKSLEAVERDQEEIIITRNRHCIARLIPEKRQQDSLSVFGDLHRTLDVDTADSLWAAIDVSRKSRGGRLSELRKK